MDNISIASDDDQCCKKITKNLFNKIMPRQSGALAPVANKNANLLVKSAASLDTILYAITVNIHPMKSMNKKRWFTYSHDKQRDNLARIERSLRTKNPTIELIELHYEVAPAEGDDHYRNIHFHAMYRMPKIFVTTMETYYNRILHMQGQRSTWKSLDIQEITSKEGWLNYMRKDLKN